MEDAETRAAAAMPEPPAPAEGDVTGLSEAPSTQMNLPAEEPAQGNGEAR
ncbi:hypothetical protein [uncultured Desulfovibrio sp.]|nr:hypothetical protein [uncultured Desulfovibrio sp.]